MKAMQRIEALVVCSSALSARARGRDAVDLALACLALGWETELLLLGEARSWLHAQAARGDGLDNFPRTLASLPLYDLAAIHVLDDAGADWPPLADLPAQTLSSSQLPALLARARHVFHP